MALSRANGVVRLFSIISWEAVAPSGMDAAIRALSLSCYTLSVFAMLLSPVKRHTERLSAVLQQLTESLVGTQVLRDLRPL